MANAWEDFGAPDTTTTPQATPSWQDFGAPTAQGSPTIDDVTGSAPTGKPNVSPNSAPDSWTTPEGGWGLSPQSLKGLGYRDDSVINQHPIAKVLNNALPNIADVGYRGIQAGEVAFKDATRALDNVSKEIGLADLPQTLGLNKLVGQDLQILPGEAIGALSAAFPAGGAESGLVDFRGPGRHVTFNDGLGAQVRADLDSLYDTGSKDQILKFVSENGLSVDEGALDKWVAYRDSQRSQGTNVPTSPAIIDSTKAPTLEEQAVNFKGTPEPTAEDLFGKDPKTLAESGTPDFFNSSVTRKTSTSPDAEPAGPIPARPEDLWPTDKSIADDAQAFGDSLDWQNFKPSKEPTAEDLFTKAAPKEIQTVLQQESEHLTQVQNEVAKASESWKNSPDFEVVNSVNDIADPEIKAQVAGNPNAKGFVGSDGKVRIIAQNVKPDEVSSVVYHEALGHNGMSNVFQDTLDHTMTNLYNQTPWFRDKVNRWMEKNSGAYMDRSDRVARAADEVIAEMSENGEFTRSKMGRTYDLVANTVKDFGRKAGVKVEYSPREVNSIIQMAHDSVTKDITPSKNLFSIGPRFSDKVSLTPDKIKTTGDIDDALDFLGNETQAYRGGPVSIEETRRTAQEYGFNLTSRYLRTQGLSEKNIAARIEGGKQALANQVQGLLDLRKRAEAEGLTPSLMMDLQEKIATASAVYSRFDSDTAEIGRSLRLLREVTESRKLGNELSRFMEGRPLEGALSDPEALTRFLDRINQAHEEGGIGAAAQAMRERDIPREVMGNLINLPRALMSTADLSAPFRQGLFLIRRPQFWKNIPQMIKQFASKDYSDFVYQSIIDSPNYPLMQKAGLHVMKGGSLVEREENFMSNWVEKIPGLAGSERAYNGFLHKLRADTFNSIVDRYKSAGVDLTDKSNKNLLRSIGKYVDTATGRGSLGKFEEAAPDLNALFFSPRLMMSRIGLLNPRYYAQMDPLLRREALKDLVGFGAVAATTMALAKVAGMNVEIDPRSSDFAKLRKGDTRYDILGGFGQYLTLGARIATNQKTQLNGDVIDYGKGYRSDDITDAIKDFFRNKFAPVPSYVVTAWTGKNPVGQPFSPLKDTTNMFVPMIAQDMYDGYTTGGISGVAKVTPGFFGVGVQTFPTPPKRQIDTQGREIANPETDNVTTELDRLNSVKEGTLGYVGNKIKVGGKDKTLTPEEHEEYQKVAGTLLRQEMKELIDSPRWRDLSDDNKIIVVKYIRDSARKDARDALFGQNDD